MELPSCPDLADTWEFGKAPLKRDKEANGCVVGTFLFIRAKESILVC